MAEEDTACKALLRELERIWDEVGESHEERDRLLFQLEQECLDVYRRKVDQANCGRARLHQALADAEAQLAGLSSCLGERPSIVENRPVTLKEQLLWITPQIEALRLRQEQRTRQIQDVKLQIEKLSVEISGSPSKAVKLCEVDEDLSMRKLHEYESQLRLLQTEQNNRRHKVLEHVSALQELCNVMKMDFSELVRPLHPSLDDPTQQNSVSDKTLSKLAKAIDNLVEERMQRLQKLQDLAASLIELWNLMDVPTMDRGHFKDVTRSLITADHSKIMQEPGSLGLDILEKAESEVSRLGQLKMSKMRELVLKKQTELQEICLQAHMECDPSLTRDKVKNLVESVLVDPSELLRTIEQSIAKAREESLSRKEIMDKMEKWITACEEESWLEDYSKDESRYNASKGAHLNLKRAERARVIVAKLPVLLESLGSKTKAWEDERGRQFLYNGVSLLETLDNYSLMRKEKEEEKRRFREQKKIQEQLLTEQESLYGSTKPQNQRKGQIGLRPATASTNCRLSMEPSMTARAATASGAQKNARDGKKRFPLPNYVSLQRDETSSVASCESAPNSPVAF